MISNIDRTRTAVTAVCLALLALAGTMPATAEATTTWSLDAGDVLRAAGPVQISADVIQVDGAILAQPTDGEGGLIELVASTRIVVSGSILGADGASFGVTDTLVAPDGGDGSSIVLRAPTIEILPGAVIQPGLGGQGGAAVPSAGPDSADVVGGDGGDGGWLVLDGNIASLPAIGQAWLGNAMGGDGGMADANALDGPTSAFGGDGGHYGTVVTTDPDVSDVLADREDVLAIVKNLPIHVGLGVNPDDINFGDIVEDVCSKLYRDACECSLYGCINQLRDLGGPCPDLQDCLANIGPDLPCPLNDVRCWGGFVPGLDGLVPVVTGLTEILGDGACDGANGADAHDDGPSWTGGPAPKGATGTPGAVGLPGERGYDGTGPGKTGGYAVAGDGTDGCLAGKGGDGGDASANGGAGQAGGEGGTGGSGTVLGGNGGIGGNGGPAGNGGYAEGGHPGCGGYFGKPGAAGTASATGGVSPGGPGGPGGAGVVPGQHGTSGAPQSGMAGTMITHADCVNN